MRKILVTGGRGFLGRNLVSHFRERTEYEIAIVGRENSIEEMSRELAEADIIFHLAGINRPSDPGEFETGNADLTKRICQCLRNHGRAPKIVFSSSIQAELANPYGASKAKAEDALREFARDSGASLRIYRLKNLFGKWCRPNYNSVTATFCHNVANDLPISVSDPDNEVELSYIDDVVAAFLGEIAGYQGESGPAIDIPSYRIRLGDLAGRIQAFHEMRTTITLPDFEEWFNRALYATYLSYVPSPSRQFGLNVRSDDRGSLAEFVKQKSMGQIFASRTKPGITRGNHYHHTKTEKFFVLEGTGLIRMRSIEGGPVEEYRTDGKSYRVVDIPPGFTHSITNIGNNELLTLFWSSEIFNPDSPDTYFLPVDFDAEPNSSVMEYA